jgi:cell division topological specificity factor
MSGLFDRITNRKRSAKSAKERLQLVLIHDRTDMTQAEFEALRDDILAVISRHVDIDPGAVRIDVEHDGREQRLIADIPLRSGARRRSG